MKEANINLHFIVNVILKNIIWILIVTFLGGAVTYAYSKYTTVTTYTSSVKFLVRNITMKDLESLEDYSVVGLSASSISASKSLINTYIEVIKTENALKMFLDDIKENGGYQDELTYKLTDAEKAGMNPDWVNTMSIGELKGTLRMSAVGETEILQINVVSTDVRKCEAISIALENVVPDVVDQLYDIGSVRVIESATTPYISTANHLTKVALGAVIGFLVAAAVFLLIAYLDNTIKCEEDVKELLGILSLGEVPDLLEFQKHKDKYLNSGYGKYGDYEGDM